MNLVVALRRIPVIIDLVLVDASGVGSKATIVRGKGPAHCLENRSEIADMNLIPGFGD